MGKDKHCLKHLKKRRLWLKVYRTLKQTVHYQTLRRYWKKVDKTFKENPVSGGTTKAIKSLIRVKKASWREIILTRSIVVVKVVSAVSSLVKLFRVKLRAVTKNKKDPPLLWITDGSKDRQRFIMSGTRMKNFTIGHSNPCSRQRIKNRSLSNLTANLTNTPAIQAEEVTK